MVKQLATQVQSRLEEVDSRLDSGNAETSSLEQRLTDALGELQQSTDAEFNAVREEEAAAIADVVKSLEEQGASTASDLATLRSDINETMREADVASSTLRTMDQTVVKQLADNVEQRCTSLNDSISVLDSKMQKSLEEQGASIASDLATLRGDINETMRESEVTYTSLRTMDQTVVKQLAESVEQRCTTLSDSISVLESKMLVDISNSITTMREELGSRVETVAMTVVDSESRLNDALTEQGLEQHKRHQQDLQAQESKLTAATEAVEQRIGEVEDHATTIMEDHIGSMDRRIDELDTKMLDAIETKLEPLSDAFAVEKQETLGKLRQLHARMVASEVSKATLRLACETAVRELHGKVSDFSDGLLEVEDRIEPLESEERGPAATPWPAEVLSDQLAESEGQLLRLDAAMEVLSRRVGELEEAATDNETAAAWGQSVALAQ